MRLAEEMRELTQHCLEAHGERVAAVGQMHRDCLEAHGERVAAVATRRSDTAALLGEYQSARGAMGVELHERLASDGATLRRDCREAHDDRVAGVGTLRSDGREAHDDRMAAVATRRSDTAALLGEYQSARGAMGVELHERLAADGATLRRDCREAHDDRVAAMVQMRRDAGELRERLASEVAELRSSVQAERSTLQAELAEARRVWSDFSRIMRQRAAQPEPAGPRPKVSADDLTALRGIGAMMQARLAEAGITTFAQLATSREKELREKLGKAGARLDVAGWIAQARQRTGRK